ncbi:MAG: hypothetical protein B7Y78_07965, partial [Caulobacter sp. 35-67-4]
MTVSRPLLIGLIASATLNVFLVGGVVGALWVRQAPPAPSVQASAALPPAAPVVGSSPRPSAAPAQRPPPATSAPPSQGENLARPPLWMAGKGLSQESRRALRRTLREANQRNQPVTRQARAER